MKALKALVLLTALAACQPPLETPPIDDSPLQDNSDSGLVEREPDICGAAAYRERAVGQPSSVIPTLGVTRQIRVIPHGGIVTQEYSPYRMNFYLDGSGLITRVSCG
ncbi:I78 family peptidase inhibitor [Vannielia litorea]|uniref:Peptidase inhibitor I78 family protein n=1 Tax=Vannielia litorea TaxID=1217970 RepID=A0A1N6IK29_9RHOB|nr:I78 family peptidase inhibitor [Vannielia litorea]SIO32339.1 Peptidase inhibitor I78 family protein [Vannielia litorea]